MSDLAKRLRFRASACPDAMASSFMREAAAALEAREGMVLVPREPTREMQDAMLECIKDGIAIDDDAHRSIRHGYRAMLAAARVVQDNPIDTTVPK